MAKKSMSQVFFEGGAFLNDGADGWDYSNNLIREEAKKLMEASEDLKTKVEGLRSAADCITSVVCGEGSFSDYGSEKIKEGINYLYKIIDELQGSVE